MYSLRTLAHIGGHNNENVHNFIRAILVDSGCVCDCDFVDNKCDFKPNRRT
jgi:hypothetical protein